MASSRYKYYISRYDLKRFVDAHRNTYASALEEIHNGKKQSHWMWYIFPQLRGLGRSHNANYYGIVDRDEAIMFLHHPVLGRNLREITREMLAINHKDAEEVLGDIDAMKFRSSMTLFDSVCPGYIFSDALQKYYGGKPDGRTLRMLQSQPDGNESLLHGGIIGAIIGDIAGSFYESRKCNRKSTEIDLFTRKSRFTDDTVMTIAVADWLLSGVPLHKTMPHWGRKYPNRGYGGQFYKWLFCSEDKMPYNSFGNGSAMRVSPCGYYAKSLEEAHSLAKQSAEVTHNHPEGIKGAQAIASAIFLARQHKPKDEIRDYIERTFGYNLHRTCDDIRPEYQFDVTCQGSCPEAIIAFLDSHDYESAIRLAISIGGDSDTIACMAGGIAAAYYGLPSWMVKYVVTEYLPENMLGLIERFEEACLARQINYNRRFTPERIKSLQPGEIFVFGSNLMGHHAGGAAYIAHKKFGAVWGQGTGLQGQSYAIPTMQGGACTIKPYVDEFIEFAKNQNSMTFLVTRIGCGIAGFCDKDIAPFFKAALDVQNIILPETFVRILEYKVRTPGAVRDMLYGQTRTLVDILKAMDRQEPVKDERDAAGRIYDFLRLNQRCGDGIAGMALEVIMCLLSGYHQKGLAFDLDRIEKDLYEFHDGHNLWEDSVDRVYYKYCVAKLVRYVSVLNTFRRYKDFNQIDHDIHILEHIGCGDSRDDFFSMSPDVIRIFLCGLQNNAEEIFGNGRLNDEAIEKIFFRDHQELLDSLGFMRMIEEKYGMLGCHGDIKVPLGKLVGPIYRKDHNGKYNVSCHGYRPFLGNTWFEMNQAKELLDGNLDYKYVDKGYVGYYVPVRDYTLPVISDRFGIMDFNDEMQKIRFIEKLESDGFRC